MSSHTVMKGVCQKIPIRIPSAVVCGILIPMQGAILNYYMATHKNKWCWLWTLADVFILVVFALAFFKSFHFLNKEEKQRNRETQKIKGSGHLPLGWIAWLVYSLLLSARMVILFTDIVQRLDEKDFFGPNTLKLTIASAAFVCLLLINTHHDAPYGSAEQAFISSLSKGTTLDILDTVAILDVLFITESHIFLTFEMHKSIIAIAFINLVLPTVPLFVLSRTRFGKDSVTTDLKIAHTLIYMVMVNVPLFIIRLILWHVRNQNISVFLIKNILGIAFTIKGVFEIWVISGTDETDHGKPQVSEHEMKELKVNEEGNVEMTEAEKSARPGPPVSEL